MDLISESERRLARTCAALGDPTRVAIVARLARGEASVREITRPFDLTQQAVSRHLRVLEEAGLVTRTRAGQARPARLEVEGLLDLVAWVGERRQEWADRHDALAHHLEELQAHDGARGEGGGR